MKFTLVVVPTVRTKERLSQMMLSAPFTLNLDSMFIELGTIESEMCPWDPQPDAIYSDIDVIRLAPEQVEHAEGGAIRVLDARVVSNSLTARTQELGVPQREFKWVLSTTLQASRAVRSFLASFANTLVAYEDPFVFSGETVLTH